jgi:uncharacterized membrane protein YccC
MPLLRHKDFFLLSTGFITAIAACVSSLLAPHLLFLALFLFFTSFVSINVGLLWPVVWDAAFISNYYANLSSGFIGTLSMVEQRFACILIGFGIAMLLQTLFFPNRLQGDLRVVLADCVNELRALNQAIFACYLATDYDKNSFFYDKELHARRRDYLYEMHSARVLLNKIKPTKRVHFEKLVDDIERCNEVLLSLSMLTHRVTDHSTFQVAYKELSLISENIYGELSAIKLALLKKKSKDRSDTLKEDIYQLEDVNRSALNVVSNDPMVFLIFLQDLSSCHELLKQLFIDAEAVRGKLK